MKYDKLLRRRRRNPAAEFASDHTALLLAGAAVGAALVYLTSGRGRRHREIVVERTVSAARTAGGAVSSRARGLRDRFGERSGEALSNGTAYDESSESRRGGRATAASR